LFAVCYLDQQMHNTKNTYFICLKNNYMFRCTSLITLRWPYVFYINSLQDRTYKTVQPVHTATNLTTAMYSNYNSWQLTKFYRFYFIINCNDHVNILIYWFYRVCKLCDFRNFSKVEGQDCLKMLQMHRNM
jgi:hypothetical protein